MRKELKWSLLSLVTVLLVLPDCLVAAGKGKGPKNKAGIQNFDYDNDSIFDDIVDQNERIRNNFIYIAEEVIDIFPIFRQLLHNLKLDDPEILKNNLVNLFYKIDKIAADVGFPLYKPETVFEPERQYCFVQTRKLVQMVYSILVDHSSISQGIEAIMDISSFLPQTIMDCGGQEVQRKYGKYFKKYARGENVDPKSLE